ncbi:MAG: hypothetical protein CVU99_02525 [Firmicutes bacterium HGW-Firmicutes-4]|jgi:hypothetical protein|nr:MAG: hypothetical protein CVU99_02525 [Firmicutes bacterium HGW-Firmicutes-4]
MIEIRRLYEARAEDIGWFVPSNIKDEFIEKEKCKNEQILIVGRGHGFTDEQVIEIYKTIERLGCALKEIANAIAKAIRPVIEFMEDVYFESFDFYSSTKKKKIYQADYRMKSNAKKYGYIPNYRGRMFCVGDRGNYRRF